VASGKEGGGGANSGRPPAIVVISGISLNIVKVIHVNLCHR
jgi:hypothetical protein